MNLCFEQSFLTAAISSVVAGGYGMAAGDSGIKAVGQVFFGTFAGGITAELSGGNFWEGAATGFVVSLLNHTFHSIVAKSNLNKQLRAKYGNKLVSPAPVTQETVDDMISGVPAINSEHSGSGSPDVYANNNVFTARDDADAHYYTNVEGATNASGGHNIQLYRASFNSYRNLAYTMIHELQHARSMFTGLFATNYKKMGGNWSKTIALDEIYSYGRSYHQFGISPYYPGSNLYISGLQSSINTLGLTNFKF